MLFLWQSRLRSAQFAHWRATFVKTAVGFWEQKKKKGRRKGRGWLFSCFTAQVQGTHWKSPLSVTSLRVLLLCANGGMRCLQRETDAEPDNWHRMGVLVSSTSTTKDTQLLLFYSLPAQKRKWGWRVRGRKWHQCHLQHNWHTWPAVCLHALAQASVQVKKKKKSFVANVNPTWKSIMYLVEEQSVIFLKSFLVAEVNIVGVADSFNHSLWLWLSCGYNYRTSLLHTSTVDDHYE